VVTPRRPRAHQPRKVTPRLIHSMVRRLVRQFDPEQIILFGSQARGTAGPDSDVDLLVVMAVTRAKKAATEIAMGVALHDVGVPKDIIVVTPDEIAQKRNITGTIIYPALREGQLLYVRR
jgi:predicted nucleotidyltransferase